MAEKNHLSIAEILGDLPGWAALIGLLLGVAKKEGDKYTLDAEKIKEFKLPWRILRGFSQKDEFAANEVKRVWPEEWQAVWERWLPTLEGHQRNDLRWAIALAYSIARGETEQEKVKNAGLAFKDYFDITLEPEGDVDRTKLAIQRGDIREKSFGEAVKEKGKELLLLSPQTRQRLQKKVTDHQKRLRRPRWKKVLGVN